MNTSKFATIITAGGTSTRFGSNKLLENLEAFMSTIMKVKPSTVKGDYVKNIAVSTTMGPGIKIITNSFDK